MMRITILFGGTNKERLVSVASAQALHPALPEADLWFWDIDDTVHEVSSEALLDHARPFEEPFKPDDRGMRRSSRRSTRPRPRTALLVLGLHGGTAENGELQAMCEMRGIAFTGSGSASSHLAFDKVAAKRFAAIAGVQRAGRHRAGRYRGGARRVRQADRKAGARRIELRPDLRQCEAGPRRRPQRGQDRRISDRAVHRRRGSDLRRAGAVGWLGDRRCRRSRSFRPRAGFDYTAKYLAKSTQEICPGRFAPEISAQIMDQALRAHRALSCSGYSRTDFIVSEKGPIYLETNTLPGLTKASLYPKALKAQGIEFADFLQDQIALAAKRAQK